jgi:hypothetical protein
MALASDRKENSLENCNRGVWRVYGALGKSCAV